MSASSSVLLEQVVPALGALISTVMYASPLPAVAKAAASRSIGDINAVPFSVTVANTIIWLSYGLLKHDPFITFPNACGVVLAMYATLTAFGLADEKTKNSLRNIVCAEAVILPLLGVITVFACSDLSQQQALWGLAGNAICLVYYGAPLSTMGEVIKTKNSASILVPLTLCNLLNACLWTAYGVAVADLYVWLPNGIGAMLSLAQVLLTLLFPSKGPQGPKRAAAHSEDEEARNEREPLKKDYETLE